MTEHPRPNTGRPAARLRGAGGGQDDRDAAALSAPARGRLSALSVPQRLPMKTDFVWGFCVGAQGA